MLFDIHTHIGLDLDETLADSVTDGLEKLHALGKMHCIERVDQIRSFDWSGFPDADMTGEELLEFWKGHSLEHVTPYKSAIDGVYQLSSLGKTLSIVTARNEHDHRGDTERWIGKYFPEIHPTRIHFANHLSKYNHTKSKLCKSYGITLMIDDGLHNAVDLAENGIDCILIDRPWNQTDVPHPRIHRMKDWEEIIATLNS